MDAATAWGLILSGGGLAASVWAAVQAGGAKAAVAKIITKSDEQLDRDKALALLKQLHEAKDAAMGRRKGASSLSAAGRSLDSDLKALQVAQDALATETLKSDAALTSEFRRAANELDLALKSIDKNGARDGWADALACLQGIISKVDVEQRKLALRTLT